jgi:excisionase family DNA binding protein
MTSAAAAFTLGVTQDTIREWVLAGKLAAMSPGEFPLVTADSVGALLATK